MELSGILPILSGITSENEYVIRLGWGGAFSTVVDSWAGGRWYIHAAGGQAISRFFSDLSGQGLDLVFDPDQHQSYLPLAWGGYVTYEHHWSEKVFSNFTYGTLFLETKEFSSDETYFRGGNLRFNTFWSIVEGARVGAEYIYATRMDKGGAKGRASRVNLLFYYDF